MSSKRRALIVLFSLWLAACSNVQPDRAAAAPDDAGDDGSQAETVLPTSTSSTPLPTAADSVSPESLQTTTASPRQPSSTTTPTSRQLSGYRAQSISPNGHWLVGSVGEYNESLCISVVEAPTTCLTDALEFRAGEGVIWAPDGGRFLYAPTSDTEWVLMELQPDSSWLGTILLDDGVRYSDDPSKAIQNYLPVWLNGREIAYVRRPGQGVEALVVVDVELNAVVQEIALPSTPNSLGREVTSVYPYPPPVVLREEAILLAGYGQLWAVDLADGSVVPLVSGLVASIPELLLSDGRIWLSNPWAISDSLQSGEFIGVPTGTYLLDVWTAEISPMFLASSEAVPIVGPIETWVDAEAGVAFASVYDFSQSDGDFPYVVRLLEVPLDSNFPVDPGTLEEVFTSPGIRPGTPNYLTVRETWSNRILVDHPSGSFIVELAR